METKSQKLLQSITTLDIFMIFYQTYQIILRKIRNVAKIIHNNGINNVSMFRQNNNKSSLFCYNKSVFSYQCMPTTWQCPHLSAAQRKHVSRKINQYLLPTGPTAANLLLLWAWAETEMDGQMDGWTDTVPFHRLCSAYNDGIVKNKTLCTVETEFKN